MEAVRPDGSRRLLADWQDNLVTDYGLNALGNGGTNAGRCHVGTGNTPPNVADTTLAAWKAANSSKIGDGYYTGSPNGGQANPPYYGWKRGTYRFAAGSATGNLSEVGLSSSGINEKMLTRALIKDVNGNPTTITVLADEMLDVTYEIRMYPPLTDVVKQVVISGNLYTFTIRARRVVDGNLWGYFIDHEAGLEYNGKYAPGTSIVGYYNVTTLGPLTGTIDGSSGGSTGQTGGTNLPYENGTLFRDFVVTFNTGMFTRPEGMSGLEVTTTKGSYQILVSPPIPKNGTNNLQLVFRVSWARYTP